MYAVIFKATINDLTGDYVEVAERMRALAFERYGCKAFTAVAEGESPGDTELAVSYWESEEQIKAWRNDPEHLRAQARGKEKWYTDYQVQVVKVLREYAG